MTKVKQLTELIDELELLMQQLGQWQATPPSKQALSSQQPFAIDTLTPSEWLQWIFIARIRLLIEQNQPLPSGFSIAPYFEECWKEQPQLIPLVTIIQKLDEECR